MSNDNNTKPPKISQRITKDSAPTPSYKIPVPPPPQKSNSSGGNNNS